jgi:hypothetical protein
VLLTEVGRRVAENERLVAEVIATVPVAQTDLFAKPPDETPTAAHPTDRNGYASSAHHLGESDHG